MMQNDERLKYLLEKKEIPEPSESLDARIMDIISREAGQTAMNGNRFTLGLAWFFFILGLAAGIIITTIFVTDDTIVFGVNLSDKGLILKILCSSVILVLFERLYRQSMFLRNKQIRQD
jgi:hypothetical protein